ncbi:Neither inactivation nor afterpotential protein C [Daphnia magna]|uniref:non-specific serine/threonine protein kinase n=1 Tax=Daphnia magna TaxID=35525 RepID=A0A0P5XHN7_9CRUS|nr:Neither inactivation nor afterpotential protein C [Daphnia magna]
MSYLGLSEHIDFESLPNPSGRIRLDEVIGEGTYGEVFRAFDLEMGQSVAVKVMEQIADNIEEIEEEFLVLRDLCLHPNIPAFHGLYLKKHPSKREEDQLWFVMELCSGGSVTDLVHGLKRYNRRLTEEQIAYILRETIEGLVYLHRNHCMHRDIKGHNILLTDEAGVKLIDYGVSSHTNATLDRKNTSVGTPYWMAPEVIACEQQLDYSYDMRCDVWSLGITAIELADGDPPLSELHPMRALFQIPRNPPPTLCKPGDWSAAFNDFIAVCLVKDFEQRPFSRALLDHPFLSQVPPNPDSIRYPLMREVQRQMGAKNKRRAPEPTTKQGKLKADRKAKLQRIYLDDLASLENFSIESIVDQLEQRYRNNVIYTYIGDILVAVNPFAELNIYTDREVYMYRNRARSDNPPHVFAMADAAYHAMLHQRRSQCIVISGESGAGKTVTANFLLKQLVTLGKAPNRDLEEKILMMNPIMEAFGNARTGINDNSSRFGKYLDVTFTSAGMVSGARLSVYLLEHSRVVQQAANEKNFHIFYYLCDGLAAENKLGDYFLDSGRRSHRYVTLPPLTSLERQINAEKYQLVRKGFDQLGFASDELDAIYSVMAAVIHIGDLDIVPAGPGKDNTDRCKIANPAQTKIVAKLLGVEPEAVEEALTSVSVVTRGETITRHNGLDAACATREAMAKGLYSRLFDWVVQQINRHLSFGRLVYGEPLSIGLLDIFGFENHLGPGGRNSFEQLCINIANEQIQYFFNQHVFTWEQQEYMAEGINVEVVEYTDNRPVLDMFLAKPLGLLALLDEESRFPGASDISLIEKFQKNITSDYYIRHKAHGLDFTVQHYAGRVSYEATSFLEKNRNFLPHEVVQLLRNSQNPTVQFLFNCPLTKTGNLYSKSPFGSPSSGRKLITPTPELKGRGNNKNDGKTVVFNSMVAPGTILAKDLASQTRAQQTVSTYFRHSLMELLQKMIGCSSVGSDARSPGVIGEPHFIRCIKPNDTRRAGYVDRTKIAQQLRYTGVLETVRIRKQGFSHRLNFVDFLKRYCFLAFDFEERVVADRETCQKLLVRLKLDGWAVGKTKVFLKYYHVEYLSKVYDQQIRRIIQVQSCVRRWLAKLRLARHNKKVGVMTPFTEADEIRASQEMKQMAGKTQQVDPNEAATVIQKSYRGYKVRVKYGDELMERFQENSTLQRKYGRPQYPQDATQEVLSSPSAATLDEKTKNSIRRRRQEMVAFAAQITKLSQENHQILRRCKGSISSSQLVPPPANYVRPNGFKIMPAMLAQQMLLQTPYKSGNNLDSKAFLYPLGSNPISDDEDFDENVSWDSPLTRAMKSKHDREKKIDVNQEMRDQIGEGGLMSQNQINIDRENQMIGQWKQLFKKSSSNSLLGVQQPLGLAGARDNQESPTGKRPIGKLFPDASAERPSILKGSSGIKEKDVILNPVKARSNYGNSKENLVSPGSAPTRHVIFQRETSVGSIQDANALRRSSMTRQTSVTESLMSPQSDINAGDGPFNFRQLLRKTEYAPTNTLKKMKERSSTSVDE